MSRQTLDCRFSIISFHAALLHWSLFWRTHWRHWTQQLLRSSKKFWLTFLKCFNKPVKRLMGQLNKKRLSKKNRLLGQDQTRFLAFPCWPKSWKFCGGCSTSFFIWAAKLTTGKKLTGLQEGSHAASKWLKWRWATTLPEHLFQFVKPSLDAPKRFQSRHRRCKTGVCLSDCFRGLAAPCISWCEACTRITHTGFSCFWSVQLKIFWMSPLVCGKSFLMISCNASKTMNVKPWQ